MRRAFKYKARLSSTATARATQQLGLLRDLYNTALQQRQDARHHSTPVTFAFQCRELTDLRRTTPEYAALDRKMCERTLRQLDLAFQAFFRRVRNGERPGYPRFKGRGRFRSMTYRQSGWKLEGSRLMLQGIGVIRLHFSRPIQGRVKTVTLKQDRVGDWWVVFACEGVPSRPLPDTGKEVGLDLGLQHFLATSEGELVDNPRFLRTAEGVLKRAQRRVSRRKKGSNRRRKAVRLLAKAHRTVAASRRDWHFKLALDLVRRYDRIAVEDLNVSGMVRSRTFAKSIQDAGWVQFIHALHVKAEEAGREVVVVDPRGTSQECSGCGQLVRKDLSVRVHECKVCGLVLNRDVNAARNILARAGPSGSGGCLNAAA